MSLGWSDSRTQGILESIGFGYGLKWHSNKAIAGMEDGPFRRGSSNAGRKLPGLIVAVPSANTFKEKMKQAWKVVFPPPFAEYSFPLLKIILAITMRLCDFFGLIMVFFLPFTRRNHIVLAMEI